MGGGKAAGPSSSRPHFKVSLSNTLHSAKNNVRTGGKCFCTQAADKAQREEQYM